MVRNQTAVVETGRKSGLKLERDGESISLQQWATELLAECAKVATLMDQHSNSVLYAHALNAQVEKIGNPDLTPSAKVIQALGDNTSFFQFTMQRAQQHSDFFAAQPADADSQALLSDEARRSLLKQAEIEDADRLSFSDFVHDYLAI